MAPAGKIAPVCLLGNAKGRLRGGQAPGGVGARAGTRQARARARADGRCEDLVRGACSRAGPGGALAGGHFTLCLLPCLRLRWCLWFLRGLGAVGWVRKTWRAGLPACWARRPPGTWSLVVCGRALIGTCGWGVWKSWGPGAWLAPWVRPGRYLHVVAYAAAALCGYLAEVDWPVWSTMREVGPGCLQETAGYKLTVTLARQETAGYTPLG